MCFGGEFGSGCHSVNVCGETLGGPGRVTSRPRRSWIIMENQSAGGSPLWEVYDDKCDRSWNTFNCQDKLQSWRHDSFGKAKRRAWQMRLGLKPQRIKWLLYHFFTSVLSSLSIIPLCILLTWMPSIFSKKTFYLFQLYCNCTLWLEFNTVLLQIKLEKLLDVSIRYAWSKQYF